MVDTIKEWRRNSFKIIEFGGVILMKIVLLSQYLLSWMGYTR